LIFKNHVVDTIIKKLIDPDNEYKALYKLCYVGYRPLNTLKLHEKFAGLSSYPFKFHHLQKGMNSKDTSLYKNFKENYVENN